MARERSGTVRNDNDHDQEGSQDRRARILDGARAAFLRFGFERSSIADIAAGAGVSRTALYHYFPGKEEVLRAVVDELHATTLGDAVVALETSESLGTALTGLLEAKFGQTLAVVAASPHGMELMDATNRLTGTATRAADDAFQALVVKALVRHGRAKGAAAVADTLVAAAKGLMRAGDGYVAQAKFSERMRRLVGWLVD
jgi:AcrR family transcriptional regulator